MTKKAKYQPMIREYDAPGDATKFAQYWIEAQARVKSMPTIVVLAVALAGIWHTASGMDDRPVVDPDVRAVTAGGKARVLVELHVESRDPSSIRSAQDEVLRRLTGTSSRLTRRYTTAPLLALEIDDAALARLEQMTNLVARVRADRISTPSRPR